MKDSLDDTKPIEDNNHSNRSSQIDNKLFPDDRQGLINNDNKDEIIKNIDLDDIDQSKCKNFFKKNIKKIIFCSILAIIIVVLIVFFRS